MSSAPVNGVHPPNTTVNGEPLEPPIPHADLPSREKRAGSYCVLALDGGGYRGYASLLMLKRILPSTGEPPTRRVYPYQYFDLICGTSTGGLIAILLGALHLDIDEAIKLYKKLSKTVFAGRWRWLRWILRDERFSSRVLRETMGDVIERQGCKNMLMIQSDRGKGCKCFVTTATKPRGNMPIRLVRSYSDPTENVIHHPWTILDAALATSAAPTYFRAHGIPHEGALYRYEDAGVHGSNNPIIIAWDECTQVFATSDQPYCIISLGTGLRRHDPVENYIPPSNWILETMQYAFGVVGRLKALSRQLSHESTKVEDKHKEMLRIAKQLNPNPYFRFSPDTDGVGNISLSDSNSTVRMDNGVFNYMDVNQHEFNRCAKWLLGRAATKPQDPFADSSAVPHL